MKDSSVSHSATNPPNGGIAARENAAAIARAGWSLLRSKMTLFALAGLFGVLSGVALIGITTSGDANIGNGYTLLSIAGVILGGGEELLVHARAVGAFQVVEVDDGYLGRGVAADGAAG